MNIATRKTLDISILFYVFHDEARHGVALKGMLERYFAAEIAKEKVVSAAEKAADKVGNAVNSVVEKIKNM